MTRQYSEDELNKKIELAKNDIMFRVSIDSRLDSIEKSLDELTGRKSACVKAWREDILWFVGVPASVLGLVVVTLGLFKK